LKFSDSLLKQKPYFYDAFVSPKMTTQDKFNFLLMMTSKDEEGRFQHKDAVTNDDIAAMVGEILLVPKALSAEQKFTILRICSPDYTRYWDGFDHYSDGLAWHKLVPEAAPYLQKLLRDEDNYTRMYTIQALSYLQNKTSIPAIRAMLNDKEDFIRAWAIIALGEMGDKESIPLIRKSLNSWNKYIRPAAVYALGCLDDRESLPEIREALKSVYTMVFWSAIEALGKLGDKQSSPEITKALKDSNWGPRQSAARVLRDLDARESMPEIRKMLNDIVGPARYTAIDALAKLGDKESVPKIKEMLEDDNDDVRAWAAIALVELGAEFPVTQEIIDDVKTILLWRGNSSDRARNALRVLSEIPLPKPEPVADSNGWIKLNDDAGKWDYSNLKGTPCEFYVDENERIVIKNPSKSISTTAITTVDQWQDFTLVVEFLVKENSFFILSVRDGIPVLPPFTSQGRRKWQKYTVELKGSTMTIRKNNSTKSISREVPVKSGHIIIHIIPDTSVIIREFRIKPVDSKSSESKTGQEEKVLYTKAIASIKASRVFDHKTGQITNGRYEVLRNGTLKIHVVQEGEKPILPEGYPYKENCKKTIKDLEEFIRQHPDSVHLQNYKETITLLKQMVQEDEEFPYFVPALGSSLPIIFAQDKNGAHREVSPEEIVKTEIHYLRKECLLDKRHGVFKMRFDNSLTFDMFQTINFGIRIVLMGNTAVPELVKLLDDRRPITVDDETDSVPARFYRYQDAAIDILQTMFSPEGNKINPKLPLAHRPFPAEIPAGEYFSEYLEKQTTENKQKINSDIKTWVDESMNNPVKPEEATPEQPK